MGERIAHGEVFIEVNDREALARLNAIRSEYARTMDAIDREQATVEIDGNVKGLERALREAQKDVEEFEAKARAANNETTKQDLLNQKKRKEAAVERYRAAIAGQKDELSYQRQSNKEYALTEKRLRAIEQYEKKLAALAEKVHRDKMRRINLEARVSSSLYRQQLRELSLAERHAHQMEKERNEVPKLEAAYNRLLLKLQELGRAKFRVRKDEKARFMVELEENDVIAQIDKLRQEVNRRVGRDPVTIDIVPRLAERAGARTRKEAERARFEFYDTFAKTGSNRLAAAALVPLAAGIGVEFGKRAGGSARDTFKRTFERGIGNTFREASISGAKTGVGIIGKAFEKLGAVGSASVRLGPFTTSIRGAVGALTAFGPMLVGVIGSLGSLISLIGSAALGVGALGVALAGGAVPAMLGFGLVIKDVIQEFQNVKKAQKAYDDAVLKHGKTSDQAQKKMKELRTVMGGVSAETTRQVASAQKLGGAWDQATRPAKASVWKAIGEGIQTGSEMMDMFAQKTNTGMDIAEKGTSKWLRAIRSAAGQQILGNMMDRFNESLGPAMDGLGHLAAYFAKVGQAASVHLPGLANTFRNWAKGINATADEAGTFQAKIDKVVESAKSLGRLSMSAGRFMKAFFGGGVDAGQNLADTMTAALDRWTGKLTGSGAKDLENFFNRSVKSAQALYSVLAPILASFGEWAALMEPVVTPFFQGAGAIGKFAASLLELTALRGPVTALAATLGVLWSVGRIGKAAEAVRAYTAALFGMSVAQSRVAATGAAASAATAAGGRGAAAGRGAVVASAAASAATGAAGAKAAQSARQVGILRAAAQAVVPAIAGMGAVAGGVATAGLALVAGAAIYGAYKIITMKTSTEKLNEALAKSREAARGAADASYQSATTFATAAVATRDYERSVTTVAGAKKRLAELEAAGKTNTQEYANAQSNLRAQLQQRTSNEQRANQVINDGVAKTLEATAKQAALKTSTMGLAAAQNEVAEAEKEIAQARKDHDPNGVIAAQQKLAKAQELVTQRQKESAQAERELETARNASAATAAEMQRALRGMVPLGEQAAQAIGKVARSAPKTAIKIATKYEDPKDAAAVARKAQAALRSGTPKSVVTKAIADTGSARAAMRELNAAKITPKRLRIVSEGGDKALAQLRNIVGTRLAPKVQKVLESGALTTKGKIQALIDLGVPPKTARILGDNSDALSKARQAANQKIRSITQAIIRTIQNPGGLFSNLKSIYQNVVRRITGAKGADGGMFAGGGYASTPDARQQDRAARTASLSGVGRAESQKVTRPRYLVGEEATPEFVIATNPAYRKRNQSYAAMAARAVGLDVVDPRRRAREMADEQNKETQSSGTIRAAAGYFPKLNPTPPRPGKVPSRPRNPRKRTSAMRRKAYRRGRDWNTYIDTLKGRQSDLEREVTIRESQVKEPEDLIVEVGRIMGDGVDDNGNKIKVDLGPEMAPNVAAIETYKTQMQEVINAYQSLRNTVNQLYVVIPMAKEAFKTERSWRNANRRSLKREIEKDEKIVDSKKASKSAKNAARKRLGQNNQRLSAEEKVLDEIREDLSAFDEDRKEAGFDLREIDLSLSEAKADQAGMMGEAIKDAAAQNASTSGSGSGGSGGGSAGGSGEGSGGGSESTGGLSVAQQTALLGSEKGSAYKAFAGNMINNLAVVGSAAKATLSGGMRSNLASVPTIGGSAAGSVMASSGAASGAFAASGGGVSGYSAAPPAATSPAPTSGGDKTIIVNNDFKTVPPDPHTFAKGVEFEVASII